MPMPGGDEIRALLDDADGALDKDTSEQIRHEELDLPDDAEVWITAGTHTKINRLFAVLDRQLKDEGHG